MQVLYKSTRGKEETVTASMAILKGLICADRDSEAGCPNG